MGKVSFAPLPNDGFHSINVDGTRTGVTTFLNNLPILMEIQRPLQWPILGHNEMERRTESPH